MNKSELINALAEKTQLSKKNAEKALNQILEATLSFYHKYQEYSYHLILDGFFTGFGYQVLSETEAVYGRSDLIAKEPARKRCLILELKHVEDENKINELYELANNRSNFNFIYLGTHALPVFTAIIPNCNFDDSDLSFSYVMEESGRTKVFGVFSREYIPYAEKNKMLIADNIIHFIYLNVKRLN